MSQWLITVMGSSAVSMNYATLRRQYLTMTVVLKSLNILSPAASFNSENRLQLV